MLGVLILQSAENPEFLKLMSKSFWFLWVKIKEIQWGEDSFVSWLCCDGELLGYWLLSSLKRWGEVNVFVIIMIIVFTVTLSSENSLSSILRDEW